MKAKSVNLFINNSLFHSNDDVTFDLFQISKLKYVSFDRSESHELGHHKIKPAYNVLIFFVVITYEGHPRRIYSIICESVENKTFWVTNINGIERSPETHASVEVLRIVVGILVYFVLKSIQVLRFFKQTVQFIFALTRLTQR